MPHDIFGDGSTMKQSLGSPSIPPGPGFVSLLYTGSQMGSLPKTNGVLPHFCHETSLILL